MYKGYNPKESYISQTGQYQFDFWTTGGQKERVLNALETISPRLSSTRIGGEYVPVASEAATVAIDALNVALLLFSLPSVLMCPHYNIKMYKCINILYLLVILVVIV